MRIATCDLGNDFTSEKVYGLRQKIIVACPYTQLMTPIATYPIHFSFIFEGKKKEENKRKEKRKQEETESNKQKRSKTENEETKTKMKKRTKGKKYQ